MRRDQGATGTRVVKMTGNGMKMLSDREKELPAAGPDCHRVGNEEGACVELDGEATVAEGDIEGASYGSSGQNSVPCSSKGETGFIGCEYGAAGTGRPHVGGRHRDHRGV